MTNTKHQYEVTNSNYLKANPTWHTEDSPWKATQVLKMLMRNNINPKSVVEIGCGAGEILNQLHNRLGDKTIQFSGYEISPDAFKFTKERENEKLHFFQEDLTIVDKKFDVLLMIDVFEHVDDYLGFIKKAKEKAEYKIYHIPLDMSVLSILTNSPMEARKSVGHLHYFMKDTALATLRDSNQEVLDWFYTSAAFEVNNKNLGFLGGLLQLCRKITYKVKPNLAVKLFGGFSLLVLTK
jgi:SAM-dependent methyltransferase